MAVQPRILVCEDSATYARGLTRFLETGGDLEVVGVCETGEETLEALPRLAPDLVTMDLELPGMGGIRVVEEIMRAHAVPILVLSGHVRHGSEQAAEALAAGALEALPKTAVRIDDPEGAAAVALRYRLARLARATVNGRAATPPPPAPSVPQVARRPTVVGIVTSTGGPRALATVLEGLPADFPVPVLVVQHMAAGFMDGLVQWLDGHVSLPVGVARRGQRAEPGIWFPPDDAHLLLGPSMVLGLDSETDAGPHRPSADMLLCSMAASAGSGAAAAVLTGMGRDGAAGVEAVRDAGGYVIAQDEETSAVFGMPRAAIEAGADLVLPLDRISAALAALGAAETSP